MEEVEGDDAVPLVYLGEAPQRIRFMDRNAERRRVETRSGDAAVEFECLHERLEQDERQVLTTAVAREELEQQLGFLNRRLYVALTGLQANDKTMA